MNAMQYYKDHLRILKEEYCKVGRRIRNIEGHMYRLQIHVANESIGLFYEQLLDAMNKHHQVLRKRIFIYEEFIAEKDKNKRFGKGER